MEDTMFFIQDTDPRRADLLSRMSEIYFAHSYVPVTFVFPFLQPGKEWAYGTGMPRATAMISGGLLFYACRFAQVLRYDSSRW